MNKIDTVDAEAITDNNGSALYFDIDSLPHEGFTSGLLIAVREMIRRLIKCGYNAQIASIAQSEKITGFRREIQQGIPVNSYYFRSFDHECELIRNSARKLIDVGMPDVIFLNTPAVFFREAHSIVLDEAIKTNVKVVVMIVDELFPKRSDFKDGRVDKYYELFNAPNVQVLAISNTIRQRFFEVTGIQSDFLPQLFNLENILAESRENRFVTMINTHPIKGISIFDQIAKLLPEKEFMVVENWTDVPPYKPSTGNVKVSPIFASVKELYNIARIILVPSLCNEGASRVVIEAMANGIPVIAHRIGSLQEIGGNLIHFVEPPPITGYEFHGSIMYPLVREEAIMRTAKDFSEKIVAMDGLYDEYSDKTREMGLNYCRQNDDRFKKLTESWFPR